MIIEGPILFTNKRPPLSQGGGALGFRHEVILLEREREEEMSFRVESEIMLVSWDGGRMSWVGGCLCVSTCPSLAWLA